MIFILFTVAIYCSAARTIMDTRDCYKMWAIGKISNVLLCWKVFLSSESCLVSARNIVPLNLKAYFEQPRSTFTNHLFSLCQRRISLHFSQARMACTLSQQHRVLMGNSHLHINPFKPVSKPSSAQRPPQPTAQPRK